MHVFRKVPAGGPYSGVDVTCNYPKYGDANDWEFRAGPFTYEAGSEIPFRFRGPPPDQKWIKVDLVLDSPGPAGKIMKTKWIK